MWRGTGHDIVCGRLPSIAVGRRRLRAHLIILSDFVWARARIRCHREIIRHRCRCSASSLIYRLRCLHTVIEWRTVIPLLSRRRMLIVCSLVVITLMTRLTIVDLFRYGAILSNLELGHASSSIHGGIITDTERSRCTCIVILICRRLVMEMLKSTGWWECGMLSVVVMVIVHSTDAGTVGQMPLDHGGRTRFVPTSADHTRYTCRRVTCKFILHQYRRASSELRGIQFIDVLIITSALPTAEHVHADQGEDG